MCDVDIGEAAARTPFVSGPNMYMISPIMSGIQSLSTLLLPEIITQRILLRTPLYRLRLRLRLRLRPLPFRFLRRIRLLTHLHQRHQLLEFPLRNNPPRSLLVASGETLPHPLHQIRRIQIRHGFQRRNDIDGRIMSARTSRDAAGKIHHAGEIARIGHEHDFELGGFEMAGPSGRDDGMDLGGAVDAEDGDGAVLAEFGGGVGLAFDFVVDFGAGGEEAGVGEDFFGGGGGEEGGPGGYDVESGCTSCCGGLVRS